MLVLSRKKNEAILINDDIEIVVVEIRGDKVRLGINAPQQVPVHRREVYDAIKREQAAFVSSVEKAMVDAGAIEVVVATGEVNPEQAIGRVNRPSSGIGWGSGNPKQMLDTTKPEE